MMEIKNAAQKLKYWNRNCLVTRQEEFMKVICTFRLFREKVPLCEALALAAEEQSSGIIILVTYVGTCSFTTCYLCFISII